VAGDILQAWQIKGVIVDTMAVMTHQSAAIALGVIILIPAEAVIDEQNHASP
jgi:hypothetical protein